MRTFGTLIRPSVSAELDAARFADRRGAAPEAFSHLERAHILGQQSTVQHARVHASMLFWALRQRIWREVAGQVVRLIGALTKTPFGLVPTGNTGGVNVSPFESMPIPADLQKIINNARPK